MGRTCWTRWCGHDLRRSTDDDDDDDMTMATTTMMVWERRLGSCALFDGGCLCCYFSSHLDSPYNDHYSYRFVQLRLSIVCGG